MAYDEGLAQRIREHFQMRAEEHLESVTEKKMFGGLAFMLGGNMCCGIIRHELMVRVGPDAYQDCLAEPHAREMDFTGRALKGMIYVASEGLEEDHQLASWVDRGANFASSLPVKT